MIHSVVFTTAKVVSDPFSTVEQRGVDISVPPQPMEGLSLNHWPLSVVRDFHRCCHHSHTANELACMLQLPVALAWQLRLVLDV